MRERGKKAKNIAYNACFVVVCESATVCACEAQHHRQQNVDVLLLFLLLGASLMVHSRLLMC